MFKKLYAYLQCNSGATGIEYGFIVGSIGVTVASGAYMFGNDMSEMFETFSAYVNAETDKVQ